LTVVLPHRGTGSNKRSVKSSDPWGASSWSAGAREPSRQGGFRSRQGQGWSLRSCLILTPRPLKKSQLFMIPECLPPSPRVGEGWGGGGRPRGRPSRTRFVGLDPPPWPSPTRGEEIRTLDSATTDLSFNGIDLNPRRTTRLQVIGQQMAKKSARPFQSLLYPVVCSRRRDSAWWSGSPRI
jgi:hypothetical protein